MKKITNSSLQNINNEYKEILIKKYNKSTNSQINLNENLFENKEFLLWLKSLLNSKEIYTNFILRNSETLNNQKQKKPILIELNTGHFDSIVNFLRKNNINIYSISPYHNNKIENPYEIPGNIGKLISDNNLKYILTTNYHTINKYPYIPKIEEIHGIFSQPNFIDNTEETKNLYDLNNASVQYNLPLILGVYGNKNDIDTKDKIEKLRQFKNFFIKDKVNEYNVSIDDTDIYYIEKKKILK